MERAAYRRWAMLIGEELMLFGASSSFNNYKESAIARMADRKDLPRRPPRYMKSDAARHMPEQHQLPATNRASAVDSIVLPLPHTVAVLQQMAPLVLSRPECSSAAVKPAAKQAASSSQHSAPLSEIPNAAEPGAKSAAAQSRSAKPQAPLDATKGKQVQQSALPAAQKSPPSPQKARTAAIQSTHSRSSPRAIASSSAGASSNSPPRQAVSDVSNLDFDTQESWDANNVRLDTAIAALSQLSQQVTRLAGDLEMIKASTIGDRRSRPFTPGSTERPAKIARDARSTEGGQALQFAGTSTQQMLEGLTGESSSSGDGDESDVQEASGNYEQWDLARYKRAKTERARGRFWVNASEEAKQRLIEALLAEPALSPVTVQARQKGWIPF